MNKKQHTRGRAGGITIGIALFLAFVLIIGLCLQVFATNDKLKPSEWFKKDEQTEGLPDEGENAFVQDTQEHGIKLMSARAETSSAYKSSYTLTATVLPEDADNKLVTWSIAWENPTSAWATGKNVADYFSLTYGADNTDATATDGSVYEVVAKVKQAYGEYIIVKVVSQENNEIAAEVRFGYLKTLKNYELFWQRDGEDYNDEFLHFGDGKTYSVRAEYELTDGTDTPEIDYMISTIKIKQNGSGSLITGTPTYDLSSKSFVCTESWYQNFFGEQMSVSEFKRQMSSGVVTVLKVYFSFIITSDKTTNIKNLKWTDLSLDITPDLSHLVVPVNGLTVDQGGELYF